MKYILRSLNEEHFLHDFLYVHLSGTGFLISSYLHVQHFISLEDRRTFERFLLALSEGPSGPLVKMVKDSVPREHRTLLPLVSAT